MCIGRSCVRCLIHVHILVIRTFKICEACGLTTLGMQRLRGDEIEVLKILNDHENIVPNILFKIMTGKRTRGHDFTLVKGQSRLGVRKYSFSHQRTVNECIKLSADCVHSNQEASMGKCPYQKVENLWWRCYFAKDLFRFDRMKIHFQRLAS